MWKLRTANSLDRDLSCFAPRLGQNLDPLKYTSVVGLAITAVSCAEVQASRRHAFLEICDCVQWCPELLAVDFEAYIFYDVIANAATWRGLTAIKCCKYCLL